VRRASPADRAQIAELYASVEAGHPVGPEEFQRVCAWLLEKNPFGEALTLVGSNPTGTIAGHLALQPIPFFLDGTAGIAGGACQLMVAETARQSLLFPALVRTAMRGYTDVGMDFTFGLTNKPRVLRAELALGFRAIGVLPVYARPYRTRKLVEPVLPTPALRPALRPLYPLLDAALRTFPAPRTERIVTIERNRFTDAVERLFVREPRGVRFRSLKNQAVLNWRFADTPRNYRILLAEVDSETLGYVVLREMPMRDLSVLAVVDLEFPDDRPEVGAALMRAIHRHALEARVDVAACLISPCDSRLRLLKRYGYLRSPESFTLIVHTPPGRSPLGFDDFSAWRMTWFEHDYT
jgi:hypothetical protein